MIRIGSKALFAFTALTLAGSLCAGCAQAPQATETTSDAQVASTGQEATDATSSIPADAIAWEEASQHIGETVTIVGPVVSTDHDKAQDTDATFLDLGLAYPDPSRFSVTIYDTDQNAFPQDPQLMYANKTISVTGKVYQHEEVCYINVSSPSQIEIME